MAVQHVKTGSPLGLLFIAGLLVFAVALLVTLIVLMANRITRLEEKLAYQQQEIDRLELIKTEEQLLYLQRQIDRLEAVLHMDHLSEDCSERSLKEEIERVTGLLIKPRPNKPSSRPAK